MCFLIKVHIPEFHLRTSGLESLHTLILNRERERKPETRAQGEVCKCALLGLYSY